MGYDYPETRDALRNGNVVGSLTQWANSTLGARNTSIPFNASKVTALQQSFSSSIPCWPLNENEMAYDGDIRKSYKRLGYRYLGSNPANTVPTNPRRGIAAAADPEQPVLASMSSPLPTINLMAMNNPAVPEKKEEPHQVAAEPRQGQPASHSTLTAEAKESSPNQEHEHQVEPVPQPIKDIAAFQEKIVKNSIPTDKPTVADRCGHGRKLVCHNKMTQWNIYFTVDK